MVEQNKITIVKCTYCKKAFSSVYERQANHHKAVHELSCLQNPKRIKSKRKEK